MRNIGLQMMLQWYKSDIVKRFYLYHALNPEDQDHPEDNWVWSPQKAVNMHIPKMWGEVTCIKKS